ncbi:hypothetical protein LSAT2_015082 [Lamellibrachia satsuma]|nr:hypothetical protein LSAT2_015082 [Lamellibrachia satsuma]
MITRLPRDYPSGGTPSTPRCLTRACGLTGRCCGCRRHDALFVFGKTLTPTRANATRNTGSSLETSTEVADERTRTENVTRPTSIEEKITYRCRR